MTRHNNYHFLPPQINIPRKLICARLFTDDEAMRDIPKQQKGRRRRENCQDYPDRRVLWLAPFSDRSSTTTYGQV
jgi:hypothetical protein